MKLKALVDQNRRIVDRLMEMKVPYSTIYYTLVGDYSSEENNQEHFVLATLLDIETNHKLREYKKI
jgi:hypothetical protein